MFSFISAIYKFVKPAILKIIKVTAPVVAPIFNTTAADIEKKIESWLDTKFANVEPFISVDGAQIDTSIKSPTKDTVTETIESVIESVVEPVPTSQTSDKQSLKKVSKTFSNDDSSFNYQKITNLADYKNGSVKGKFNSNKLDYNQYQKMQDLVKQQEQVSRYQELEKQDFANKISDQQPSEEHVINHHILEQQYQ